ncbi:MAG: acyl-CoA ligase (AMP-forming), exosortase A system-associated [Sphingomonadaceae bacterium]
MVQALDERPQPLDRLTLRGSPDAPALAGREGSLSFAELERAVGVAAAALRRRGLNAGDRVASWLGKTRAACLMPLATARAGLVHVPINPLLKRAQVAHILADSGTAMLITGKQRRDTLEPDDVPSECALADEHVLTDADDVMPPSIANPSEIAAILYTSGSTGRPKGVVLSHANLWLGAISVAHYLRLEPTDRTLCVLPLSFDYGQNQLLSTWAAGGCAVPLDYLAASDVVKAAEAQAITVLAGVPPLWVQLVDAAWPDKTARRLRTITNSGGPLPVPLIRRMRVLFPDAALHSMYGLTEAFRSTSLDPALIDSHPDSIGTAIPFAEVLVVRPDGSVADDDKPGELVHAGALVAQGYWRDAPRTAERFRPAPKASKMGGTAVWSGDTVMRGGDGLLRFVGRDDDMIKTSGNRVSPNEIEEAAVASGLASEAAAWGVSDEVLGQAILLAVAARAEDIDHLKLFLKRQLPNFMQPRRILQMNLLPRNINGKIDRVELSKKYTR